MSPPWATWRPGGQGRVDAGIDPRWRPHRGAIKDKGKKGDMKGKGRKSRTERD